MRISPVAGSASGASAGCPVWCTCRCLGTGAAGASWAELGTHFLAPVAAPWLGRPFSSVPNTGFFGGQGRLRSASALLAVSMSRVRSGSAPSQLNQLSPLWSVTVVPSSCSHLPTGAVPWCRHHHLHSSCPTVPASAAPTETSPPPRPKSFDTKSHYQEL